MRIGQTGSSMLETACLVIETTVLVLRARSRLYPSQILQENALESSRRDLPKALLCTGLHRFGIHKRKMGKKGPGQNNPEKRRKQENERPLSGPQQAT